MDKYAADLGGFFGAIKDGFNSIRTSRLGHGVMVGAGIGISTLLVEQLAKIISEQHHIYKSKEYYEKMLQEHPQLKQFPPEDIAKYFKSLNHFAPSLAADPLAAGAFLTQSLKKLSGEELGGPPPDTFNTLTDIQKKISDSRGSKSNVANKIYETVTSSTIKGLMGNGFGGD
ncbi:hypothetical protein KC678_05635 [Candidatus Dojkabacteria bacterium]|uniref:Uncharacterized protein n=1 Tax=Candidatus Dojkabacteria bacterium TaxID=2099670 RepID=A0A955L2M2_9BACT|nr:hypothetical protein [Candidatus Dojkabacteria bacterium]